LDLVTFSVFLSMLANVTRFSAEVRDVDPDATLCYLEFYERQLKGRVTKSSAVYYDHIRIFAPKYRV